MELNDSLFYIIIAVAAGVISSLALFVYHKKNLKSENMSIEKERARLIEEAKREAEVIKKDAAISAKDHMYQAKAEAERDHRERTRELNHLDKRLRMKEETIDKKLDSIEKKEQDLVRKERGLGAKEQAISDKEAQANQLIKDQMLMLEKISNMRSDEAKAELFRRVEEESRFEAAKLIKKIEDEAKETAEKKAHEVIGSAIQRYAADYVADATISAVSLPGDEMKGRIIGREGRNIRAFEAATGVDIIVDDTPEIVTLSAHDPVRREIARLSLEKLVADGRIHPARIEEIVEKNRKDVEATIREEGEKAVFELGLSGVHPEIIKTLGRLKYRTSYGQNVLQHSKEVAFLAGMMAGELGIDVKLAKRGGLLHDIGKAVDHEMEGSHQEIGAQLARKYGESDSVINAIMAHHGDVEVTKVESALVAAGDALSAARPGVRRESIEYYLKRLEKLEEMALSFNGVEKCYAIQAGREVRIIVKPEAVNDEMCTLMARELGKKIEAELTYPGQIKVTVIRESRHVEYAR
jgi:ribonucrease Y